MKKKARSKTESGILKLKGRIQKQIEGMASSAKTQVERKSNWVAGKVERAMKKVERKIEDQRST